ncbi:MAG: alpha/beta hydrolase [Mycolicibacterium rufum]|nr:alpha/beta hydrolase [Mycolicibacterium rufum]
MPSGGTSPLVLLHGLAMSGNAWREVVPLVSAHHDTFVPTAAGHRGGPSVTRRPASMTEIIDAAERYLDDCGLDRPHLAGNSMGGFVAIELARRGRAATVCAFSPAGFWTSGDGFQQLAFGRLQRGIALGRFTRPLLPLIYRSPTLRRLILRDIACHADRIPVARALEFIDDGIGCEVLGELCAAVWRIETLDPAPCPITVAWGEEETLLPAGVLEKIEPIPQASLKVLPDVGHVPMVDDPGLVARTILTTTGALPE